LKYLEVMIRVLSEFHCANSNGTQIIIIYEIYGYMCMCK